jgi:protease-4
MSTMHTAYPPQPIVVYTQSGWSRFWSWIGWLGFFVCGLIVIGLLISLSDYFDTTEGIEEKYVSGAKMADDKVAIITVAGVIMEGDGFVKRQIDKVREDKNVKAIVVRVDSPGGTVTGSDYIYHHLKKLRDDKSLPLVVSMGGMAASGGYYVSMAVGDKPDTIFAEPTCSTGSIGVMIPHYDISGLLARFDVKDDSLATHERKLMLSMTRPMKEEHRQIAQAHIEDMFDRFKDVIKEGRPVFAADPALLDKLATGEIFTTEQAIENKLVDKEGYLEDAVDRAIELAKLDKSKTRVIKYKRPLTLFDGLSTAEAARHSLAHQAAGLGIAELLELSTPRPYYLATSLPALITSRRAD